MTVLLVRHTHAGERGRWDDDDRARPVSDRGRRQAQALVELLAEFRIDRVLSSPYTRCVQSVQPLADARGLDVEPVDVLAEGVDRSALEELLDGVATQDIVLCSHGDVIDAALRLLGRRGVDLGTDLRYEKGSIWVLDGDGERLKRGRYLPPPAV